MALPNDNASSTSLVDRLATALTEAIASQARTYIAKIVSLAAFTKGRLQAYSEVLGPIMVLARTTDVLNVGDMIFVRSSGPTKYAPYLYCGLASDRRPVINLTVKEVDGAPLIKGVHTLVFPNSSVTPTEVNGSPVEGSVTITAGGGAPKIGYFDENDPGNNYEFENPSSIQFKNVSYIEQFPDGETRVHLLPSALVVNLAEPADEVTFISPDYVSVRLAYAFGTATLDYQRITFFGNSFGVTLPVSLNPGDRLVISIAGGTQGNTLSACFILT